MGRTFIGAKSMNTSRKLSGEPIGADFSQLQSKGTFLEERKSNKEKIPRSLLLFSLPKGYSGLEEPHAILTEESCHLDESFGYRFIELHQEVFKPKIPKSISLFLMDKSGLPSAINMRYLGFKSLKLGEKAFNYVFKQLDDANKWIVACCLALPYGAIKVDVLHQNVRR